MVLQQLSKGRLSKLTVVQGTFVQGTVVQADFCPRRLLSKEAFTSESLAQTDFSYFIIIKTT